MKFQSVQPTKLLFTALMITALFCGTTPFAVLPVFAQTSGLIAVINSDTIWTKADSPHNLTGPVLVNIGVTLTIEAGATVNFNGYQVRVNGTLRAIGSDSEKINMTGGLKFTPSSNGWNEATGTGSVIENGILSYVSSEVPLKITHCTIGGVNVNGPSLVSNNKISNGVSAKNQSVISNNNIGDSVTVGSSNLICNNSIGGSVDAGIENRLSNNDIGGEVTIGGWSEILNNTFEDHVEVTNSLVSNNMLRHGITVKSSRILNNTILGAGIMYDPWGPDHYKLPAVSVSGECVISDNTIRSREGGSGIRVYGSAFISGNKITDTSSGIYAHDGNATIERNLITDNSVGINFGKSNLIIRNNTIYDNKYGVYNSEAQSLETPAVIELNLIANNTHGVYVSSEVIIRNNLIANSSNGVYLNSPSMADIKNNTIVHVEKAIKLAGDPSKTVLVTINYNNIENYRQNSIYLIQNLKNIDVTNNWWGTTDVQAINLTIYDFKYDFDLGKVSFIPILSEPNPNAEPKYMPMIPEFPSWLLLPLFLVTAFVVVTIKNKIIGVSCTK